MRIQAFRALRPPPSLAAEVASVPYDTVDTAEARALAEGNERSFLHVVRPEIDLPAGTDIHADEAYEKAVENLERLQADGSLVREAEPCIYVYRQSVGDHVQTGIVACCLTDDYARGTIKRHEHTRPDKEDDRTRLVMRLRAHSGPVFLTYPDTGAVDRVVCQIEQQEPLFTVEAEDGVTHRVWRCVSGREVIEAFREVPAAYVADGHHRAAAAVRVARELREASPSDSEDEHYNRFLTVLFPASQLRVLAINRSVRDLNGMRPGQFLDAARKRFWVEECPSPPPTAPGEMGLYVASQWYRLVCRGSAAGDPVAALDAAVLQEQLLAPVLGVGNPRTDERLDFIAGSKGPGDLARRVDAGEAAVAFALHPVAVQQMIAVADAGLTMPPKSTWFVPKLLSGLFVHTF